MKIEKVVELIQTQIQLYPNTTQMDSKAIVYYASAIADIEDQYLINAFRLHLETQKFFPTVSEIRKAAAELAGRKSGIPIAYEAWREVNENASKWLVGEKNSIDKHEWSHPLVKETARLFGWDDIRMSDNLAATRARFMEAFNQIREREERNLILSKHIISFSEPDPRPQLSSATRKQITSGQKTVENTGGWGDMPPEIKDKLKKLLKDKEDDK